MQRKLIPSVDGQVKIAIVTAMLLHELGELLIAQGGDVGHGKCRSTRLWICHSGIGR